MESTSEIDQWIIVELENIKKCNVHILYIEAYFPTSRLSNSH